MNGGLFVLTQSHKLIHRSSVHECFFFCVCFGDRSLVITFELRRSILLLLLLLSSPKKRHQNVINGRLVALTDSWSPWANIVVVVVIATVGWNTLGNAHHYHDETHATTQHFTSSTGNAVPAHGLFGWEVLGISFAPASLICCCFCQRMFSKASEHFLLSLNSNILNGRRFSRLIHTLSGDCFGHSVRLFICTF